MMIKELRINTRSIVGFPALPVFPVVLGWINFNLNDEYEYQPENLYKNPVRIQRAVSLLRFQILSIQQNRNSLFLAEIERILLIVLKRIKGNNTAAREQLEFIWSRIVEPTNGVDALNAIRNPLTLDRVHAVSLTASTFENDREIILAHGFDAYIPKPIENKVFFETMETTLYGK